MTLFKAIGHEGRAGRDESQDLNWGVIEEIQSDEAKSALHSRLELVLMECLKMKNAPSLPRS